MRAVSPSERIHFGGPKGAMMCNNMAPSSSSCDFDFAGMITLKDENSSMKMYAYLNVSCFGIPPAMSNAHV